MKKQNWRDRMHESYGMKDRYAQKNMGKDLRSASKSTYNVTVPCGEGWGSVMPYREGNNGYPSQAYDYNY